jgi:hypothetical protein
MIEKFSNSAGERRTGILRSRALRCFVATALALCLPLVAFAYTLVMRSGRRVEIPANFSVTRTALTYEAAPTISVTVQLVGIDIAATERANQEPSGSLLKRAERQLTAPDSKLNALANPPTSARRTINTRDLEATRREREASEAAYERRRRELGLPNLQETQQQATAETEAALALTLRNEAGNADAENYWRERASELRTEAAALDAQISYLRARLPDVSNIFSYGSFGYGTSGFGSSVVIANGAPFANRKIPQPAFPLRNNQLNGWGANQRGAQLTGRIGFGGGSTRGGIFLNTFPQGTIWRGRQQSRAPYFNNNRSTLISAPFYGGYSSYGYDELAAQLYELEAQRAGLRARQRELEDEARRAGALPGWLRP